MFCAKCQENTEVVAQGGLNSTGLILFVVLLFFCLPLCWIPFVVDSCKKHVCGKCGMPLD